MQFKIESNSFRSFSILPRSMSRKTLTSILGTYFQREVEFALGISNGPWERHNFSRRMAESLLVWWKTVGLSYHSCPKNQPFLIFNREARNSSNCKTNRKGSLKDVYEQVIAVDQWVGLTWKGRDRRWCQWNNFPVNRKWLAKAYAYQHNRKANT